MATYNDGLEILHIPKEWNTIENLLRLAGKLPPGLGAIAVTHNADEDDVWITTTPGTPMSDLILLRSRVYGILADFGVSIYDIKIYINKNGNGGSGRNLKDRITYNDKEVI